MLSVTAVVRPAILPATAQMRRAAVAADTAVEATGTSAEARLATLAVVLDTSPGTVCKAASATIAVGL